ncbi:RDD family protein [Nocardiopsis sp. HUAS JQ3]|uniref:RDD family protein n=1 Tax=Nocardiopsis sp. HUAS JQ3 TaxID=3061629 RepID=UPI0023A92BBA|nr:RDD family protein [Nocardiopsis sp. HUAS JQ3]WDZ89187.1 RDD family protein [Nocardiopsis sp. HUAS JQ3]
MNVPPRPDRGGPTPQGVQQPPSVPGHGEPPGFHDGDRSGAPGAAPGPEPVERLYPLAAWRTRVYARGIDLLLVALPALLLALVLSLAWVGVQAVGSGDTTGIGDRYPLFLSVTFFLLHAGYETLALSRWQQTLGKRRVGLRVAPQAGNGGLGAPPLAALTVRAALLALPFLLFFLFFSAVWFWWFVVAVTALLTGGMAAWNRPNRQGLHDRIAGTVVLDVAAADPRTPAAPPYPPRA